VTRASPKPTSGSFGPRLPATSVCHLVRDRIGEHGVRLRAGSAFDRKRPATTRALTKPPDRRCTPRRNLSRAGGDDSIAYSNNSPKAIELFVRHDVSPRAALRAATTPGRTSGRAWRCAAKPQSPREPPRSTSRRITGIRRPPLARADALESIQCFVDRYEHIRVVVSDGQFAAGCGSEVGERHHPYAAHSPSDLPVGPQLLMVCQIAVAASATMCVSR
jgi:hypothetical protein